MMTVQESRPADDRMLPTQRDQAANKRGEVLFRRADRPIQPADLVVLAIGVVVASLAATELVSRQEHRGALREDERREQVAPVAAAHRVDCGVVGRSFNAVIDAGVLIVAVAVVLAVRLVVLVLVAYKVGE